MNLFKKLFRKERNVKVIQTNTDDTRQDDSYSKINSTEKQCDSTPMTEDSSEDTIFSCDSFCSEDVEVQLWLPEFDGVNLTMFCDRLIEKDNGAGGVFMIVTELNCISILNIENQSSGFKIINKDTLENGKEILVLKSYEEAIKQNLEIPDNCWDGFVWDWKNANYEVPIKSHPVPISYYGHMYILNFSVLGEFDLEIYYYSKENPNPVLIYSNSFCCK